MSSVTPIAVPAGSLLANFCPPELNGIRPYRDCYARHVARPFSLEEYIERFYCSLAFRPERWALGVIGRGGSNREAALLASGASDHFSAWNVVERRSVPGEGGQSCYSHAEILLRDFQGHTASWLSVENRSDGTGLLFGSWVGEPRTLLFKALQPFHRPYSKVLLAGVNMG